jgi:hypothetical protein
MARIWTMDTWRPSGWSDTGDRTLGWVRSVCPVSPWAEKLLYFIGSSINRWRSAPRHFSWTFDILDILVSWAYSLPLISLAWLRIQSEIEWFQVYLLEWLHLVALGDCYGCGFLVTLGGCCHLDGLEQRWRSGTCWWLFVTVYNDLMRVLHLPRRIGILSVIELVFILWLVHSSMRRYNHPTLSFTFP